MKRFRLEFYRSHDRLLNQYAVMFAEAKSLERLLPRVKRILKALDKLPNPKDHSNWMPYKIGEVDK